MDEIDCTWIPEKVTGFIMRPVYLQNGASRGLNMKPVQNRPGITTEPEWFYNGNKWLHCDARKRLNWSHYGA